MFEELKQLGKLKKVKNELEKEEVTIEKNGIKVSINGDLKVTKIELNSSLEKGEQEEKLKDCFNEAMKKIKFSMAEKIKSMF